MQFRDRTEAGRQLARKLAGYGQRHDVLVLALPRGGVPVAFEVAQALHAPLDVFLVRKLGLPGHEELAMGAIATGGVRVLNEEVVRSLRVSEDVLAAVAAQEEKELKRREQAYRGHSRVPEIRGKTVILIDDGIATGSTMRAAIAALRKQHPARIVVAVPTAAASTCDEIEREVDELVALIRPEEFYAVGQWYLDFSQTTDEDVIDLLERAGHGVPKPKGTSGQGAGDRR
jgi:predicted phosphoribosyltransferase